MRVTKDVHSNVDIMNPTKKAPKVQKPLQNFSNTQYVDKNQRTIILQKTSSNGTIPFPIKKQIIKPNSPKFNNDPPKSPYTKFSSPKKEILPNNNLLFSNKKETEEEDFNNKAIDENLKLRKSGIIKDSFASPKRCNSPISKETTKSKYISISPKPSLKYRNEFEIMDDNGNGDVIIRDKNINIDINLGNIENINSINEKVNVQHEHKIRNLLSKNFPYNKPKPNIYSSGNFHSAIKRQNEQNNPIKVLNLKNSFNVIGNEEQSGSDDTGKKSYLSQKVDDSNINPVNPFNYKNINKNNRVINSPKAMTYHPEKDNNNNNNTVFNNRNSIDKKIIRGLPQSNSNTISND